MTTGSCCAASASRIQRYRRTQRVYGRPPAAASNPVNCHWRHFAGSCTRRRGLSWTPTRPTSGTRRLPLPAKRTATTGWVNDYFLVRTTRFDPRGALSDDDLAAEHLSGMRWWRHGDIAEYGGTDLFSPRDIATPLATLIAGDIPGTPVMLGLWSPWALIGPLYPPDAPKTRGCRTIRRISARGVQVRRASGCGQDDWRHPTRSGSQCPQTTPQGSKG